MDEAPELIDMEIIGEPEMGGEIKEQNMEDLQLSAEDIQALSLANMGIHFDFP